MLKSLFNILFITVTLTLIFGESVRPLPTEEGLIQGEGELVKRDGPVSQACYQGSSNCLFISTRNNAQSYTLRTEQGVRTDKCEKEGGKGPSGGQMCPLIFSAQSANIDVQCFADPATGLPKVPIKIIWDQTSGPRLVTQRNAPINWQWTPVKSRDNKYWVAELLCDVTQ